MLEVFASFCFTRGANSCNDRRFLRTLQCTPPQRSAGRRYQHVSATDDIACLYENKVALEKFISNS
jgi:hypothetical protein